MAPRKSGLTRETSAKKKNQGRKRKSQAVIELGEGSNATPDDQITPHVPQKKKGRGPGVIRKSTNIVEKRPIIWPISSCEFTCEVTCEQKPKDITAAITRLALNHMPGPFRSFHAFDKDTIDGIEFAFLEKFRYREGEDPKNCRNVLEAIAAKRYSSELHETRARLFKRYGRDVREWKKHVPHWCTTPSFWPLLCDIFGSKEWQELSFKNHDNRTKSELKVSHYAGGASAHQHKVQLAKLNKGKDPTMRELFIHLHCRRDSEGKSPIVAQLEAAAEAEKLRAEQMENADAIGLMDPITEEIPTGIEELDVNSLQFTNTKTEAIYQKVNAMMADGVNAEMDESNMFISASGGVSHGRVLGFGTMLDGKVQTATNRCRSNYSASSVTISALTNNAEQESFSRTQVQSLLADSDRLRAEDRAEVRRELATYQMLFNQLFSMVGPQGLDSQGQAPFPQPTQAVASQMQNANSQGQGNSSGTQQGFFGNLPNFQGQAPFPQPTQAVASQMQNANSQGNDSPIQQTLGFQALLSQANAGLDDVPTNEAAMGQWRVHSTYNGNHPL